MISRLFLCLNILALDLGTHTGIAHNLFGRMTIETRHWATPKEVTQWGKERWTRRNDPRIARFADYLSGLPKPDIIVFEDVQFSSYTLQVQLWASLRTAVWLTLGRTSLLECVPVTTLKKFATRYGRADKKMMEKSMRVLHPEMDLSNLDDNALDALWIYKWAQINLSRVVLSNSRTCPK